MTNSNIRVESFILAYDFMLGRHGAGKRTFIGNLQHNLIFVCFSKDVFYSYSCECTCVFVCIYQTYAHTSGGQKRASYYQGLELQGSMNCLM